MKSIVLLGIVLLAGCSKLEPVGRYQVVFGTGKPVMVDTVSGDTWL